MRGDEEKLGCKEKSIFQWSNQGPGSTAKINDVFFDARAFSVFLVYFTRF